MFKWVRYSGTESSWGIDTKKTEKEKEKKKGNLLDDSRIDDEDMLHNRPIECTV